MKHLLVMPLVALAPVASLAQSNTAKAGGKISVDPAARALFDIATAQYRAASGLRLEVDTQEKQLQTTQTHSVVSFQRPSRLRVENNPISARIRQQLIGADGKAVYHINTQAKIYTRSPVPKGIEQLWGYNVSNGTGFLIGQMLQGRSPIAELSKSLHDARFPRPSLVVTSPPPATIGGEVLSGARFVYSFQKPGQSAPTPAAEFYTWFGRDGLLRRIQLRDFTPHHLETTIEQISHQQLNPTFAPNTFTFNTKGFSSPDEPPAGEATASQPEPPEFDPRLKVGARPFAFSAKTLNGTAVSPAQYKGKVLLLDFWATWCGPCVASVPKLRATYNKYHRRGLEVVGISLDEDKSALTSFIKTNKMPWPQVFDGKGWKSRVPNIYGVKAIPFFLIIGKNGKIAAVDPREDLEGAVKRALAAS